MWIHGVASTHLPHPAHGPPGPAQPQHLGPVNKSPGWIPNMWGLVRLLLAWLGGWGCMGRLAAPVPAWAGSRGHTGPAPLRTRRSWVWNQFFVIEEYSGPEPVLIGKVRVSPSHVYCGWSVRPCSVPSSLCNDLGPLAFLTLSPNLDSSPWLCTQRFLPFSLTLTAALRC